MNLEFARNRVGDATVPISWLRQIQGHGNETDKSRSVPGDAQVQNTSGKLSRGRVLFSDIAHHYVKTELSERAPSTAYLHRHIVNDFLIPRWGRKIAVGIKPLDVEEWLKALHAELELSNPTCAKVRAVMACVYKPLSDTG